MRKINKQLSIQLTNSNHQKVFRKQLIFGGSLLNNSHAKTKRPISHKHAIHVVIRSTLAKGKRSFLYKNNRKIINDIVGRNAKRLSITILDMANVGNHIHLMIKIKAGNVTQAKLCFNKFIRGITGLIARVALKVERGKALGIKFWDQRPFTRIVESWAGLKILKNYIYKNKIEVWGLMPFEVTSEGYLSG